MINSYSTLKIKGKEYILVPRAEFQKMKKNAHMDLRDDHYYAEQGKRAVARFKAGKSKAVPLSVVKREFGL